MYVVIIHASFENKADADHIHNQAVAVATNASVARIGESSEERTSHGFVAEEQEDGSLLVDRSWHIDLFGIVREGEPDRSDAPQWIFPTGGHNAYPALNVRGRETRVTHNGQVWRNTHGDANTWEPGVYGWEPSV